METAESQAKGEERWIGGDRLLRRGERLWVDAACEMPEWQVSRYRPVAVWVEDERHAVRSVERGARGRFRYELSPWSAADGDRPSRELRYDAAYVEARDARRRAGRTSELASALALPLVPVLGLLPSAAKRGLQGRIAIEPRQATRASLVLQGLVTLALGSVLAIHLMTGAVLTGDAGWLELAVPALALDGLARHGALQDESLPPWGLGEWLWPPSWRRRVRGRGARGASGPGGPPQR